jgi:hypothetical protein
MQLTSCQLTLFYPPSKNCPQRKKVSGCWRFQEECNHQLICSSLGHFPWLCVQFIGRYKKSVAVKEDDWKKIKQSSSYFMSLCPCNIHPRILMFDCVSMSLQGNVASDYIHSNKWKIIIMSTFLSVKSLSIRNVLLKKGHHVNFHFVV